MPATVEGIAATSSKAFPSPAFHSCKPALTQIPPRAMLPAARRLPADSRRVQIDYSEKGSIASPWRARSGHQDRWLIRTSQLLADPNSPCSA